MFDRSRNLTAFACFLVLLCIAGLSYATESTTPAETAELGSATEATDSNEAALQGAPLVQPDLPWFAPSVLEAVLGGGGSCVAGGEGSTGCTLGSDCSVSSSECGTGEYPCCNPDSCGCAGGGGGFF